MTERDFCYWLQGFMEISNPKSIGERETQIIKEHLQLVFNKVTKPFNFGMGIMGNPQPVDIDIDWPKASEDVQKEISEKITRDIWELGRKDEIPQDCCTLQSPTGYTTRWENPNTTATATIDYTGGLRSCLDNRPFVRYLHKGSC